MAGKFSINKMDKVMSSVGSKRAVPDGVFYDNAGGRVEGFEFEMHEPSLAEIAEIVGNVVSDCFPITDRDENGFGGTETYAPEFRGFLIKYYIVRILTNISLPEDIDKSYDMVEFIFTHSNIDVIYGNCIGTIESAIDKKIEHKLRLTAVCREELVYSLTQQVSQLTSEVEELAGYVTEFADRIDKSLGGESVDSAISRLDEIVKRADIKMNAKD